MSDWESKLSGLNGSAVPILLGMVLARSDRIEQRLDGLDRRLDTAEAARQRRPVLDQHTWKLATAAGLVAGHRTLTGEWPAVSLVAGWIGLG